MKKLLSIVGTLALVLIPMASASAQATNGVSGNVLQGGKDVNGASVSATCKDTELGTATGSTTTASNGDYGITLSPQGVCQPNDIVTVTAQKGAASGVTSQAADKDSTVMFGLNVALVNVSIPEFGVIAGVSAAVIGGAAFMVVRRKHLSQN